MEKTNCMMQKLQVGYARESLVPDFSVNMRGYGGDRQRLSTNVLDTLYATCLALREGEETVLLFSTDLLCSDGVWTNELRTLIGAETGVSEKLIQVGATHCHTGPSIGFSMEPIKRWKPMYMNALLNAAKKAIADLAPATLYGGKLKTENMNFIRHYIMADGSYAGPGFGDFKKEIIGHVSGGDPVMTFVKAEREGDKKDIMLVNWQAHADCIGGKELSADYIGAFRDSFEAETGMNFIFFLGATGDQNPASRVLEENRFAEARVPGINRARNYGNALAKLAIEALPTVVEKIEGIGIRSARETIVYKSNNYGAERLEDAKKVYEYFSENGDVKLATAMAKSLGFSSVYECNGIVGCSEYPEEQSFDIDVVRIGDLAFVAAPYEMFSASGMYIKKNSPYPYTIVSTVTNDYQKYFPTKEAYAYHCYESYTGRFAAGIAEAVAEKFVEMLETIR